jgi:hypothetical protein
MMDNKMVESYCVRIENFDKNEFSDILEESELIHFMRQIMLEMNNVLDMPFVEFWANIVKRSNVINFLDALLMNMRKNDDIYKLVVESEARVDASLKRSLSFGSKVKSHMIEVLQLVLRLFFRLSSNMESENEFFPLEFY